MKREHLIVVADVATKSGEDCWQAACSCGVAGGTSIAGTTRARPYRITVWGPSPC